MSFLAKQLVGIMSLVSVIGWFVLLGGVAGMQSDCGSSRYGPAAVTGYLGPVQCDILFGYTWWIVFLQLGVLVLITIALTTDSLTYWKGALIGLLAVTTVLMMDTVNSFILWNDQDVSAKSNSQATVAGGIFLSMADIVMLSAIGVHREPIVITYERHGPKPEVAAAPAFDGSV